MLDTPEEESKQRSLIVDNTIHSLVTHISVSSSLDEQIPPIPTQQIPDMEGEEDNAT